MSENEMQYQDIRSLGQLLAAQNLLFVLPGEKQIADFYAQSLSNIDGIEYCKVCFGTYYSEDMNKEVPCSCCTFRDEKNENEFFAKKFQCRYEELKDYKVHYIETFDNFFGFIILQINNIKKFEVYQPFISNLSGFIGLSLENRFQRKFLEEARTSLEERVKERTNELQSLNLYLEEEIETRKKTEELLVSSEEQFRYLFESMAQGVVIQDEHGVIIDVNPAACQILGLTKEQFLRKTTSDPRWMLIHENGTPLTPEEMPSNIVLKTSEPVIEKIIGAYIPELDTIHWILTNSIPKFKKDHNTPYITLTTFTNITERKKIEDQIKNINLDLEKRVQQRTRQLEHANNELKAFAYTVSHDLRAPLRSIEGFSQILLEQYECKLDEQGKKYLSRICNATQNMGQLIEDILSLSRLSQQEILINLVNLSQLAIEITNDLCKTNQSRNVKIKIQENMIVHGDSRLLRIVLTNLLENAFKFTSKRETAIIEFGKNNENNSYFVRDNGAGFDMNYVSKLFGTFQRLHTVKEFPGTGIGLATVQRIIMRHGGSIWAEGEIDKGATFYFTLPNNNSYGN